MLWTKNTFVVCQHIDWSKQIKCIKRPTVILKLWLLYKFILDMRRFKNDANLQKLLVFHRHCCHCGLVNITAQNILNITENTNALIDVSEAIKRINLIQYNAFFTRTKIFHIENFWLYETLPRHFRNWKKNPLH